jgi:hypothetical protein
MSKQIEQERRKQLLKELKEKEEQQFELSLPIDREDFLDLFNYLDAELESYACDNTLKLTENFLKTKNIHDISAIKEWLSNHGAYCDCEILANIEERFDS